MAARTGRPSELKETPVSLFFLNEGLGWMVTDKGACGRPPKPAGTGRSCRKLPAGTLRVYFTDEKHGWAACDKKTVFETHDGGRNWKPVAAAAEPPAIRMYSVYTWIAFADAASTASSPASISRRGAVPAVSGLGGSGGSR